MKIIKIIFFNMLILQYLNAIDAQLDIIRKNTIIPSISINVTNSSGNKILINKIKTLIEKDLEISNHFVVKNNNIKINKITDKTPFFNNKKLDLLLLISLEKSKIKNKNIVINTKLFDLNKKDIILNKKYIISNINRYPFLSHKIAININDILKAPSIKWMDRFVIFSRYTNAKKSEIVISDYTLTYQKVVVKGGLNIFPKWADSEQSSFYYTTYSNRFPTLVKQNLYTSNTVNIISSPGMLVCSDVDYKSNKILLTMAPNGQADIYLFDTRSKIKQRLTKYSGIDVGGSFINDNKKIIFVSDRLGKVNIFSKRINDSGVERMVYHGKNNSQASTHENYIVYSSRERDNEFGYNTFNLYLISTENDLLRRLTIKGSNKFPKFSKDGESILFTKNYKNKSYLGIIRLNYNKSFLFKLNAGKLQSIDW
jgi:TolB protein